MNGIIIINKPKDYTSHDVVAKVKKSLNLKKVGHTGTLDPNATGVLILLLNNGTKFAKYLINHDKEYEVVLKLGIKTDTADGEGNIIKEEQVNIKEKEEIEKVLKSFIGKQEQFPPMYSAIKVNGKKLYEYAREGKKVEVNSRKIEIYSIELTNINNKENEIQFKVSCSKGTYIRSLCEDIATKLETIGYMKDLKRTVVGDFNLNQAITIEELESNKEQVIKNKIITLEELFKNNSKIVLNKQNLQMFLNGVKINAIAQDGIYNIYDTSNIYIGTGIIKDNKLKRDICV